jgi:dTMP kinase
MDLGLSSDPYESFRLFQGKIKDEYQRLASEFDFTVVDATLPPEEQQEYIRNIVRDRIDLSHYRWRLPAPYTAAMGYTSARGPRADDDDRSA